MPIKRIGIFLAAMLMFCIAASLSAQEPTSTLVPITPQNAAQLQQIVRLGNGVFTGSAAYNSTGDTLAVGGSIGLWLYDGHDLTAPPRFHDLDAWVRDVTYSSDDAYLAYIANNTAYVVDADSLETVMSVPGATAIAMHPNTHKIAVATRIYQPENYRYFDIDVRIFDINTGDQLQELPPSPNLLVTWCVN